MKPEKYIKDLQYYKFCAYGFLKNLRFFDPFLILFFLEKGLSFFQIGILYGIREISTNILEIPTGVVADVLGRRRTMIASFASYLVSFAVFYMTGSFSLFAAAMVFFSFGEAFRTGTHKALIFEYLKIKGWRDQKVYYYGNTRGWSQVGSAISSLIAAALVFFTGRYSIVFLVSTIPYVLDLLNILTYPKELDGTKAVLPPGGLWKRFASVIGEVLRAFGSRKILNGVMSLSVYGGFYKAVKDYLQPVVNTFALALPIFVSLRDEQRSALTIGIVYFILYMLTSFAARASGSFSDKFADLGRPLNVTIAAGFSIAAVSGVTYLLGLPAVTIVCFIIVFLIENLRKPIGIAYVSDALEQDILATALSAESQITSLVAAVLSPLIGLAADGLGIGPAVALIAAVLLLSIPLYRVKSETAG